MSNFSKELLYDLYSEYLPKFTELAQEANEYGVYLDVKLSPNGGIEFNSREYHDEVKNGVKKECVTVHTIEKCPDYVQDSSRTQVLKEVKV